jgi:hypothetical protein
VQREDFDADPAVAYEARRLVEHRLAAHAKLLMRTVGIHPVEQEIEERLAIGDPGLKLRTLSLVPA